MSLSAGIHHCFLRKCFDGGNIWGPLHSYITQMLYVQEAHILLKLYDWDNTHDFKLFYNEHWVEKSVDPTSMFIPITQITFNMLVMTCMDCSLKYMSQPWLVWLSGLSANLQTKGSLVQFPVRAHDWVAVRVPSCGCKRGNHTLVFLSLSFNLLSPLFINKYNKIFLKK